MWWVFFFFLCCVDQIINRSFKRTIRTLLNNQMHSLVADLNHTISHFSSRPAASRCDIYSRRSCHKEKKNRKLQMTCDVMRMVTAVSTCTVERITVKATIREVTMHWPRLTPLPLCWPPCHRPPPSLLNPDPPSTSAVSICMSPRWNKVMWQARVMSFYCT